MRCMFTDYVSAPKLHFDRVIKHVNLDRIRQRRFRVALDAVNGAGAVTTPGFLRDVLGGELEAISVDPTKPFPREAEPRPEEIGRAACRGREARADGAAGA